jgi:replication factor C subunit 3/5
MTQKMLSSIQKLYNSDIRSMINFMQSNQDLVKLNIEEIKIIDNDVWFQLINMIKNRENIEKIQLFVQNISVNYNIDKKNIIKDFINYIIRNHYEYLSKEFLNFVENLMHSQVQNNNVYIYYSLSRLRSILST